MHYDTTLKELFQQSPQRLLKILVNDTAQEMLTVEFPTVRQRKPDLVVRLTSGEIFHLELQSTQEPDMLWRMLEYFLLITRQFGQPPIQRLLYVGEPPLRLKSAIHLPTLDYRCLVTDMRDIDGEVLLQSPQFEDRLLAVLCRTDDPRRTLRVIVESIVQLPPKAQADAIQQLLILSGLRHLEDILKQEVQAMALTVDISQNKFFREAYQKGIIEGETEILLRQLRQRFGELPSEVVERVKSARDEDLLRWSDRILTAKTLEDVFQ